jgi:hypothetical protein
LGDREQSAIEREQARVPARTDSAQGVPGPAATVPALEDDSLADRARRAVEESRARITESRDRLTRAEHDEDARGGPSDPGG